MSLSDLWAALWRRGPAAPAAPQVAPAAPPPAAPELADVLLRLAWIDPEQWALALARPMSAHGITASPRRMAGFLANTGHETNGGRVLVESLNYSPERLGQVFGARATAEALAACRRDGRPANQERIACIVYGGEWGRVNLGNTEPGDGWTFRGRGLLQITGRRNYQAVAGLLRMPLSALSAAMETRPGAAETACRWWSMAGCNSLADRGDLVALRRRVNGGEVGLAEVRKRYQAALQVLSALS